jgi:O-succinylbenzoate-CoA ligase
LERNAFRSPDREAVVFRDRRITHRELDERVRALTAGLIKLGIARGDVVAVLMNNSPEFLMTTLAINGVGAIFLPLNTRLATDEFTYILSHAKCRALVVDSQFADSVPMIKAGVTGLSTVIDAGDPTDIGDADLAGLILDNAGTRIPYAEMDRGDVSRLMYTSGTTARPKGVPLTYDNILWKIFDHVVEFGLNSADRTMMAGPMYHVGAYDLPGTGTLYVGGTLVLLPRFDASDVMATIERERVTNVWLAPAMVNAILQLDGADRFDTSTIRFITNGGEKMPVALIQRFLSLFPNGWLADSFGMTETVSGDTVLDVDHTTAKLGSVGKPLMHLDIKIVDADDHAVGPNVMGELLLRGPKVFNGYLHDEEATERAFLDGWFRTGDVAHLDEDGYLFIDDRKKDMIVSGGENIASPEVERVLYSHPAVLEAAVVGVPDEQWGEVPKAIVVVRPGHSVEAAELKAHCAERLAKFKVPKYIDFIDSLPRTPTGKVLKRDLR